MFRFLGLILVLLISSGFVDRKVSGFVPQEGEVVVGSSVSSLYETSGPPAFASGDSLYYIQIELVGLLKNRYCSKVAAITIDSKKKLVKDIKYIEVGERPLYSVDSTQEFNDGEDYLGVFVKSIKNLKPYL